MDVEFISTSVENGRDVKRDFGQVDNNTEGNHGSLIEDMYGVERRENLPYKKIKIDHGKERAQFAKGANFPGPGDGGLGGWMKDGQGKPDPSAVVTSNIVDLTAGMRDFYCEDLLSI